MSVENKHEQGSHDVDGISLTSILYNTSQKDTNGNNFKNGNDAMETTYEESRLNAHNDAKLREIEEAANATVVLLYFSKRKPV